MIERVIFSPCAHLGLYFQITLSYPTLVVAYNYRTAPAQATDDAIAIELFPPLKALADETRLHILSLLQEREMYAQEIVQAVGLSQSTVSRHLQLLERTEIVTTRHAQTMKFYSINLAKGRAILHVLKDLLG
jgi:DNA-binding transcriptional ArsR family regulator